MYIKLQGQCVRKVFINVILWSYFIEDYKIFRFICDCLYFNEGGQEWFYILLKIMVRGKIKDESYNDDNNRLWKI